MRFLLWPSLIVLSVFLLGIPRADADGGFGGGTSPTETNPGTAILVDANTAYAIIPHVPNWTLAERLDWYKINLNSGKFTEVDSMHTMYTGEPTLFPNPHRKQVVVIGWGLYDWDEDDVKNVASNKDMTIEVAAAAFSPTQTAILAPASIYNSETGDFRGTLALLLQEGTGNWAVTEFSAGGCSAQTIALIMHKGTSPLGICGTKILRYQDGETSVTDTGFDSSPALLAAYGANGSSDQGFFVVENGSPNQVTRVPVDEDGNLSFEPVAEFTRNGNLVRIASNDSTALVIETVNQSDGTATLYWASQDTGWQVEEVAVLEDLLTPETGVHISMLANPPTILAGNDTVWIFEKGANGWNSRELGTVSGIMDPNGCHCTSANSASTTPVWLFMALFGCFQARRRKTALERES